jgi:hypothetical protein
MSVAKKIHMYVTHFILIISTKVNFFHNTLHDISYTTFISLLKFPKKLRMRGKYVVSYIGLDMHGIHCSKEVDIFFWLYFLSLKKIIRHTHK